MEIWLARHGETDWNVLRRIQGSADRPLNEHGRTQAAQLAQALLHDGIRPDAVYTSPQQRAFDTAVIAAQPFGFAPVAVHDLREVDMGIWEGLTWQQAADLDPALYARYDADRRYLGAPQGESNQAVLERVIPALQAICQREAAISSDRCLLIVAHSGVIVPLLTLIHNTPFPSMWQDHPVLNAQPVSITPEQLHAAASRLHLD